VDYFVDPAYFREMAEPLFAAFFPSYAFLQDSCCEVAANFPSVLEAVRNSLRCAVDTNRHSIDLRIDDTLREGIAGKTHEAQVQAIDDGFFRFAIDGHPNIALSLTHGMFELHSNNHVAPRTAEWGCAATAAFLNRIY
jgi:hypothetical protein